jgi:hypothetical protein
MNTKAKALCGEEGEMLSNLIETKRTLLNIS